MSVEKAARVPISACVSVTGEPGEGSTLSLCHCGGYSCVVYIGRAWTELSVAGRPVVTEPHHCDDADRSGPANRSIY